MTSQTLLIFVNDQQTKEHGATSITLNIIFRAVLQGQRCMLMCKDSHKVSCRKLPNTSDLPFLGLPGSRSSVTKLPSCDMDTEIHFVLCLNQHWHSIIRTAWIRNDTLLHTAMAAMMLNSRWKTLPIPSVQASRPQLIRTYWVSTWSETYFWCSTSWTATHMHSSPLECLGSPRFW